MCTQTLLNVRAGLEAGEGCNSSSWRCSHMHPPISHIALTEMIVLGLETFQNGMDGAQGG